MDPLFTSYPNQFVNNTEDLTSSLSSSLAAINLNVGFQASKSNKVFENHLLDMSQPIDSCTFRNMTNNDIVHLPLYTKNSCTIQEFVQRGKTNINKTVLKEPNAGISKNITVTSVPEFVPRMLSNRGYIKSPHEPEIVEIMNPESEAVGNELLNPSYNDPSVEGVTTYQENVNGTVYFYTAPLTQSNNTSPVDGLSASPILVTDPAEVSIINGSTVISPDGTSLMTQPLISDPIAAPIFYVQDGLNSELMMLQQAPDLYAELPDKVGENYCNLEPLEPLPSIPSSVLKGCVTSTYKVSHIKNGVHYFMRRIHNVSLPSPKCNALANNWKKLNHSNMARLREMFVTRDFRDNSIVFIYDYYEGSETFLSKHFAGQLESFNDTFSSDPNAPRPYSHTKNALLRQQHNHAMLPESDLWSYVIQLTGALRVIHGAGLACRCLGPSKIIISNRNRVRFAGVGLFDVILYDHTPTNRLQLTSHFQQGDLLELGKLLLALACGSLIAIQKENLQTSLELMSRMYSTDIRNLIAYLLHTNKHRSVLDLMPMIGARFYSHIDAVQLQCDTLENDTNREIDYKNLLKLVIKLTCINEWPDLDQQWVDSSDKYMLSLFRDYLYHQVSEDLRPWIDINQIIHSLTRLRDNSSDKICLASGNEESVLVISYDELKQCFERAYQELSEKAAYVTDDSIENS